MTLRHRAVRTDPVFLSVAAFGLTVATAVATIGPLGDPDAWWNLKAGQYLLDTGHFAGPDPWSQFSSHDFVLTEWLGSVIAAALYAPFGPAALVAMRTAGGVAIVTLLFVLARKCAELRHAVPVTLVGLLGFSGSISERPQTLGLVLFLVTLLVWRRAADSGSPPSWWLLVLAWIFPMAHGYWVLGVLVGIATTAGVALDRRSWRVAAQYGVRVAASLGVAALTPVGPRLLETPLQVRSAASGMVGEWQRASPDQPLVLLAVGFAIVVGFAWLRTGTSWWRTFHLLLALTLACTYARFSAPAVALCVPLAAEAVHRWATSPRALSCLPSPPPPVERRTLAAAALVVVLAGLLAAPASARQLRYTPAALTPAIAAIPDGSTVFDDFNVASWMLFRYPHLRLVVDTRLEVFSASYLDGYAAALAARPGWQDFVRRDGASWAVLREAVPLATALRRSGWTQTASAQGYVVLHRTQP